MYKKIIEHTFFNKVSPKLTLTGVLLALLILLSFISQAGEDDHGENGTHNDQKMVVMSDKVAQQSGIQTTVVSGGQIDSTVTVYGDIISDPASLSHIRARFDGVITKVTVTLGDRVKKGDVLATVESNESLKQYQLTSPFSGTVIARHANAGELSNGQILFSIANYDTVWAQLKLFPSQRISVAAEQAVILNYEDIAQTSSISHIAPASEAKPYTLAFVKLANNDGNWPIGTLVKAQITIATTDVSMRIPKSAVQIFEGKQVVFVKLGNEYHPRPVRLGVADNLHIAVLEGLAIGEHIVSQNSYVIKADLEKSEAGHDH
ncbi:efflux RND transporter periplasmic adaptor subunit [Rheinheimera sp. UJ51]|uniref:efflux RND transporter periplasmic adaptor subunit n=1 Tax=Rheinheimera sp. UJ51 TaxID=2892446 RepID=UPI001E3F2D08|nr:efflux RND transporter periplasmic adaptor subunit [Rheinheimera sp. UJ51]MCC5450720.1 efflux RND transporter periplasmic adaptor subunit [Rheinheimera sp. UJ51]